MERALLGRDDELAEPVTAAITSGGESRASFSWDGQTLFLGPAGDIYSASRTKNGGND